MKITRQFDWSRRDFSYDQKCEHCGHEDKGVRGGYDDDNYYNNVMRGVKCSNCGESSKSKAVDAPSEVIIPRYDPNKIM